MCFCFDVYSWEHIARFAKARQSGEADFLSSVICQAKGIQPLFFLWVTTFKGFNFVWAKEVMSSNIIPLYTIFNGRNMKWKDTSSCFLVVDDKTPHFSPINRGRQCLPTKEEPLGWLRLMWSPTYPPHFPLPSHFFFLTLSLLPVSVHLSFAIHFCFSKQERHEWEHDSHLLYWAIDT